MVNSADRMPASVPSADVVDLEVEAAPLGPAPVHAQQHLAPVLGVDAAVLGVDLHDAVGLVVLAGEQAAQLELVERVRRSTSTRGLDLGLLRLVVDLAGQLVQHLDVLELAGQSRRTSSMSSLDVGVLGVDLLGQLLVVPQVGAGDLELELGEPRAGSSSIFR